MTVFLLAVPVFAAPPLPGAIFTTVEDGSVDWVISNCVINLSPEKDRVFAEVARVLKPGGRFAISDIVADEDIKAQEVLVKQLIDNGIPILFNTEVKEIRGENRVSEVLLFNNATGQSAPQPADGVFLAIGYDPAVDLAAKVGLALTEDGYIEHKEFRTNIPGIYSAGDVEGGYKQIVTATGMGAAAAMTIFEDLINPYWKQAKAS